MRQYRRRHYGPPKWFGSGSLANASAATTTLAAPAPSSTPAGAQLFLAAAVQSTTDTIATPSGWTAVGTYLECSTGGTLRLYLFRKVAAGYDGSVTVTKTGTNGLWRVQQLAWNSGKYETHSTYAATDASTTHDVTSVTNTVGRCRTLIIGTARAASTSASAATYTERLDTTSNAPQVLAYDFIRETPGATGTERLTTSASVTCAAYHIVLSRA